MINILRITCSPKITVLAGFPYGREVWKTQCSLYEIDLNQNYYLILPKQIEAITSDFVNGFFEAIVERIGAKKAAERLVMNNKELESKVKERILDNA